MKNDNNSKKTKLKLKQPSRKRTRRKKQKMNPDSKMVGGAGDGDGGAPSPAPALPLGTKQKEDLQKISNIIGNKINFLDESILEDENNLYNFDTVNNNIFPEEILQSGGGGKKTNKQEYKDSVVYPIKSLFHFVQIYENISNNFNKNINYNTLSKMTDNLNEFELLTNQFKNDIENNSLKTIYDKYRKDKQNLKMIINPSNLRVNIIDEIDNEEHLNKLIDYYTKKKENLELKNTEYKENKDELLSIQEKLNYNYHSSIETDDNTLQPEKDDQQILDLQKARETYLKFMSGNNDISNYVKENEVNINDLKSKINLEYASFNLDPTLENNNIFIPS